MLKASLRWLAGLLLLLSVLLVVASQARADGNPPFHLVIDDQAVVTDVGPINVGGRLLLPVKIVAERLGGSATWDGEKRQVRIVRQKDVVVLTIDSAIAVVNGQPIAMDVPATIVDGHTLVPIRFVATALGAEVKYDPDTRTAFVWRRSTIVNRLSVEKEVGQARVTLGLSEPLTYSLQQDGGSAVVDLYPAVLDVAEPVRLLTDPLLKSVALFQTGERRAHLAIDSYGTAAPKVEVAPDGKALIITMPYQVTGTQYVQDGNVPTVLIPTTGPVRYTTSQVGSPDRLVIDLPGTTLAPGVPAEVAGKSLVQRIRAAQNTPDSVRVVLDLASQQPYQVVQTTAGLLVRFVPIVSAVTYQDKNNGTAALTVKANLPVDFTVNPPAAGQSTMTITIPGVRTYLPDDLTAGPAKVHLDRKQAQDGITLTVQLPYYMGHTVPMTPGLTGANVTLITSPIYGKKIWIDAGHGGVDPGAIGTKGTREKDLTLSMSLKLQKLLQQAGATVFMTRTNDLSLDFRDRPDKVNAVNPDMFLSIHMNSQGSGHDGHGTETYYWKANAKSKTLAAAIQSALVKAAGLTDRSIDLMDYYVIAYTKAPSALVEVGFLSNPAEEQLLATPAFQDKVVEGLRQGIFQYFLGK